MTPIELRIKELREVKGWSQAELARRSGVPQPTISRLEASQTDSGNLSNLEKLAQALSVPAALLIEEKRITQTVKRKTVSPKRLLELLNEALHDEALHGERVSEDCCFDGPVHQLRGPDKTGCNWSDSMQIRCSGGAARPPSFSTVARALQEVRWRYNLAD